MRVVEEVAHTTTVLLEQAGLVVGQMVLELILLHLLPLLILGVGVAVLVMYLAETQEVQAAPVSSSSRPINNEDKWKPKSIGCMESTPQCTC
jgi:hypothetical protein